MNLGIHLKLSKSCTQWHWEQNQVCHLTQQLQPTMSIRYALRGGGGLLILVLFLLHIQVVWTNRIRFYVNCTSELWRLMSNLATAATVQVTGSNFQLSSCFHCLNTLWIHFFFGRAIWVKCLLSMPQLWLTLSIHLSLSSQEQGPWLYF